MHMKIQKSDKFAGEKMLDANLEQDIMTAMSDTNCQIVLVLVQARVKKQLGKLLVICSGCQLKFLTNCEYFQIAELKLNHPMRC